MKKRLVKNVDKLHIRAGEFDPSFDKFEKSSEIIENLGDTLKAHDDKLYLTANQIGYIQRAFAIKFKDEIDVFLNPVITKSDKMIIFREKDYVTGKEYFIPRFTEVSLAFQTYEGKPKSLAFNEACSIVVCQAMDALNGVLTSDYGLEIIPEFDEASDEEKQEVLAMYINSLSETYDKLDDELKTDEDDKVRKTWDGVKFLTSIANGDLELEQPEMSNRKKRKMKRFLKSLGIRKAK